MYNMYCELYDASADPEALKEQAIVDWQSEAESAFTESGCIVPWFTSDV